MNARAHVRKGSTEKQIPIVETLSVDRRNKQHLQKKYKKWLLRLFFLLN